MSSPYRIAPTPVTSRICAQCKLAITNDQGRSGSGWPPDMKYEHTIGGCAVAVERYVSELTRERDEARANGAASERAAIVAWLSAREKNLLRLREGQALFGEDLTVVDGRIYELEAAIMLITRLDHHRDGDTP